MIVEGQAPMRLTRNQMRQSCVFPYENHALRCQYSRVFSRVRSPYVPIGVLTP
jgi:hypothetical protein